MVVSRCPSISLTGKALQAAINGACAGGGMGQAMNCDIRFAASDATFSTAFARRGLIAEWGISWALPRVVGQGAAMDLLLSARKFKGDEAKEIGIVQKVFPKETLGARSCRHLEPSAASELNLPSLQWRRRSRTRATWRTTSRRLRWQ